MTTPRPGEVWEVMWVPTSLTVRVGRRRCMVAAVCYQTFTGWLCMLLLSDLCTLVYELVDENDRRLA